MLFSEGDGSDLLYTVVTGRVKVFKTTPRGTDVILELFGPGDPVGAVAVYESRPYPASAIALEPTSCLLIPRQAFFSLLEGYPTMVRGLLVGLTHRLVELTNRLTELSGGRIEGRLARFFLKLGTDIGQRRDDGMFIPLVLSRQELADMIGTTIETSIRIMSRWGKEGVVRTDKDGFIDRRSRGAGSRRAVLSAAYTSRVPISRTPAHERRQSPRAPAPSSRRDGRASRAAEKPHPRVARGAEHVRRAGHRQRDDADQISGIAEHGREQHAAADATR